MKCSCSSSKTCVSVSCSRSQPACYVPIIRLSSFHLLTHVTLTEILSSLPQITDKQPLNNYKCAFPCVTIQPCNVDSSCQDKQSDNDSWRYSILSALKNPSQFHLAKDCHKFQIQFSGGFSNAYKESSYFCPLLNMDEGDKGSFHKGFFIFYCCLKY